MTNKKNVERLIVAAPINVANEKYFMGVMLLRDSNTQRLYLHDVIMEKETELTSKVSLNKTEAIETESNLFMTNILQKFYLSITILCRTIQSIHLGIVMVMN